jgi:glycerol-3-phosphate dehydrogenase (NAD(P)+)
MPPDQVTVIGAGSWGTALAVLLCQNIRKVTLWGRDADAMQVIDVERCNSRYLPGVSFPENLTICTDIRESINENLCFLVVVPSHAFRQCLETLMQQIIAQGKAIEDATIIWGTKGFGSADGTLLSQVAREMLGTQARQGVISGPSFAGETARLLPTALTVASAFSSDANSMADWFRTSSSRVYFSDDVIGVQLGGAIKNVMAIAAGISDGLGYGANARAALITRGLSELTRLGLVLGGKAETFMGLTGVGDLILTCTDNQSRNRRFGLGLGQGKTQSEIISEIGQEIEGINSVRDLFSISQKHDVDMPITQQVYNIIHQGTDPAVAVKVLLQRNSKAESH